MRSLTLKEVSFCHDSRDHLSPLGSGTLMLGVEDKGAVIGIALSDAEVDKLQQLIGQLLAKFEPPVPTQAYALDVIPVFRACLFGGVPIKHIEKRPSAISSSSLDITDRQRYVIAVRVQSAHHNRVFFKTSGLVDGTRRCWQRVQNSVISLSDHDAAAKVHLSG